MRVEIKAYHLNLNPGQNAGGQNAGKICIGGQNAGQFWGRVDKMRFHPIIFQ